MNNLPDRLVSAGFSALPLDSGETTRCARIVEDAFTQTLAVTLTPDGRASLGLTVHRTRDAAPFLTTSRSFPSAENAVRWAPEMAKEQVAGFSAKTHGTGHDDWMPLAASPDVWSRDCVLGFNDRGNAVIEEQELALVQAGSGWTAKPTILWLGQPLDPSAALAGHEAQTASLPSREAALAAGYTLADNQASKLAAWLDEPVLAGQALTSPLLTQGGWLLDDAARENGGVEFFRRVGRHGHQALTLLPEGTGFYAELASGVVVGGKPVELQSRQHPAFALPDPFSTGLVRPPLAALDAGLRLADLQLSRGFEAYAEQVMAGIHIESVTPRSATTAQVSGELHGAPFGFKVTTAQDPQRKERSQFAGFAAADTFAVSKVVQRLSSDEVDVFMAAIGHAVASVPRERTAPQKDLGR